MSSLPPLPPDIDRILGPSLIGATLNWCLFGVLSAQTYIYYLAFPTDRRSIKLLVAIVYLLEAAQTLLNTQTVFYGFAGHFGNIVAFDEVGTTWISFPIMGGIVSFVVQSYYAYRISILSQSKIIPVVIFLFALCQLGGAAATGFELREDFFYSHFLGKQSYLTLGVWNGGSALCDVIIAISMTIYLSVRKTHTMETALIVEKIIRVTVETGTFTAFMATLNLVLSVLNGHPTYFNGTIPILGKVYSNSMMVSLNSRLKIAGQRAQSTGHDAVSTLEFKKPEQSTVQASRSLGQDGHQFPNV